MSDLEPAGCTDLGTELVLALLAHRVPLLLLPDLAGLANHRDRSDFTAGDQCC